uniref:Uncharacterized protein LOC114345390 n=1 Tax=Diabrotica virgifera virgifera TaxID=50390 RepID=A0A6P7GR10_DIAVI
MDATGEYIDHYHPISHKYIKQYLIKDDKIDKNYGPFYDTISGWILGKRRINFDKNNGDIVIIRERDFEERRLGGTPGLYHLLFYANPNPEQYNDEDLQKYKTLLINTEINLDTLGRLKGSSGEKYHALIKPLFKPSDATMKKHAIRSQKELQHRTKTARSALV